MPMLTLIGVLFAANARVGWLLGYHSVSRYVIFWLPSTASHKREPLFRMRLPFGRLAREALEDIEADFPSSTKASSIGRCGSTKASVVPSR